MKSETLHSLYKTFKTDFLRNYKNDLTDYIMIGMHLFICFLFYFFNVILLLTMQKRSTTCFAACSCYSEMTSVFDNGAL